MNNYGNLPLDAILSGVLLGYINLLLMYLKTASDSAIIFIIDCLDYTLSFRKKVSFQASLAI